MCKHMFFPLHQDYFDEEEEDEDEEKEKVTNNQTTTVLLSLHVVLAVSTKESCVIQRCCPACVDVVADSVKTNP